ncbi:electron transfer flavoprotein subunit alpha/FixB family protein [Burkholderia humptydooensis]|uniref:Electron transfer flavoprotein subunit alpha/FixB family protein n=1 Tax=Burkholderia humptydooensis TaxID=430531 RepID=A0A7U4P556_9BURK|nr:MULTISPECIES: electron transfer flavoprotein subunit alpha/FixB family protein [Burkholderia]AJY43754.1 electron transfer flavoFAD-binding domain protein [Burkholderia sp. 2002721687]ALX43184.1 electron transfer flavoprotein subunit alpha [Burkholderia humptydooensis]QPS44905.1 electron transfer flavoprotein subunit alpha/FixB family protein [Burkholderia humptydooensis]
MAGVLFFGYVSDGKVQQSSLEAASCARELAQQAGGPLLGAVIGNGEEAAKTLSSVATSEVFFVDDPRLDPYISDVYIAAAEAIIRACAPDIVLFPQNSETNEWVPRLAARLDAALVTAVSRLALDDGDLVAIKPVSGGAAKAEFSFARPLRMATLSAGSYQAGESAAQPGTVTPVVLPEVKTRISVLESIPDATGAGPQLKTARVVVSGGLGVGSRENWKLIEEAAAELGAGVGGSRAVVELGWIPPSKQVGFSGAKISPDLYIAVGISGAVHHLAGISGAKMIVAINTDSEANIFKAARYGVVGDAKDVLPAFVERVKELRAR